MAFSVTPSQAKKHVETCMKARLVPFIKGAPGCGKSQIVKNIAKEYGLKLIDCRLSTMEPTDLNGLPWIQNGKAEFNPYSMFPLEDTPIPDGYSGWLLFFDEFNSSSKATQAAAYRVVLDREIGQHKLHPHCFVVAAGNRLEDNAIVTQLSTAMVSRVVHLDMETNFDDWRDNFAIPNKIDERIIAYLSMYPEMLMNFDPEKDDAVYACPRSWEFASRLLKALGTEPLNTSHIPLLGGAVSVEQATTFIQFTQVYKDIISIDRVLANPDIDPPKDTATLWATLIHLINATTVDNFKDLVTFLGKVPATFRIVFVRSIKPLHKELLKDPTFEVFVKGLGEYCFGE